MAKLKLISEPTFKAKVPVPVAGADKPVMVEMTFKHKTRTDFLKWRDTLPNEGESRPDLDAVMDVLCGWELDDQFNRENVETLLENYLGAAFNILQTYTDQLLQAQLKN